MRAASLALPLLLATLSPAGADGAPSPYAGEARRAIKALSQAEIDELLAGRGMGLAKAAELNGYPGPAHVLELADRLGLGDEQRIATEAIFARMSGEARRLGAEIVAREGEMERDFAARRIGSEALQAQLDTIAALKGKLRFVHLNAHLEQAALLSEDQRRRYEALRGYSRADAPPAHGHGHGGHGR